MDWDIVPEPRYCAELRFLQQRLPLPARPLAGAARKPEPRSAGLFLLLGAWATSWAALVALSSWLR